MLTTLQGGYCLKTLAEGAALSLRALLGDPPPNIDPISQPKASVLESVLNVLKLQRGIHTSLAYQDILTEGHQNTHTWQSYSPPQSKVKLRTKDNQPSSFPLLQECCDDVPEATQAAITKEMERLERDTVIASTQHRLGLLHYRLNEVTNGKADSLEEMLSQRGLLSGCHKLSTGSQRSEIATAVGAILANTVQSCVVLPSTSNPGDTSSTDGQDLLKSAAAYLQGDFHVKRILYLLIARRNQTWLSSSPAEKDIRSLVISLGGSSEVDDEQISKSRPLPVSIPLEQDQFQDGDIIAAIHQVVLPIAYEFGPDLVVVYLDPVSAQPPHTEGPGVSLSAGCVGHLLTLIQGLARGRLLLIVSPEAAVQQPDAVAECLSVLQGRLCQVLPPCLPQKRTVELIKTVQDRQKAVWKTLQFREKLPAPRGTS
ncbi:hypothetical protein V1264_020107 [Littorina saxatilis]|uniref:histone deacetylase n=1 Tax=Littorina saxatilis TaxID=31220 RepID=A0AAN9GB63_9CAEN